MKEKYTCHVVQIYADQYSGFWNCTLRIVQEGKECNPANTVRTKFESLGRTKPTEEYIKDVAIKFLKEYVEKREADLKRLSESKFDSLPNMQFTL